MSFNNTCQRWFGPAALICFFAAVFTAAGVRTASAQTAAAQSACTASGQECLCDSAYQDCRSALRKLIQNENVGIDVSMWFMTDWRYKDDIIERWRAGVPVRVIVDTQADANYPANKTIRTDLINAGIPIRDCVSSSGINHWKAMIFAGQEKLMFSAANFADGSFSPSPMSSPYINYVDEAIYFTGDPAIVHSFMRKYDDHWIDTTAFKNLANISSPLVRSYPTYNIDPALNFVPYENYENRLRTQVLAETGRIDAVMFRITSAKIPDALIDRQAAGVPVRLITDPGQYRNTAYFWDAYNVDRMYKAGIDIKIKNKSVSEQDMHQKSIILYDRGLAVFGSSNWTSSSASGQREHNYFTSKSWMVNWFVDQFDRKWRNLRADGSPIGTTVFETFTPGYPETPVYYTPVNDALGQSTTVTLKWEGGWWAHKYDIYVSTSSTPTTDAPVVVDFAPGSATAGVRSTKETFTVTGLQPGTTYYWQVVGKTMADMTKKGPIWRFTTAGGVPAPPAPTGLTATPVSSARIDLAWSNVDGEDGYKVERKLASSSTWAQIGTTAADVVRYTDSTGLTSGTTYNYRVRAYTSGGNSAYSNTATATTRDPSLSADDVVLYASKGTIKGSKWRVTSDSTAAGGRSMSNPNSGVPTITSPVANPADYFEMQFKAKAGIGYRIWMRGKASNNNGYNDSVWVQFSGAVNSSGTRIDIGTTKAEWLNLQNCSGATIKAWGWQDNGYAASPCGFLGPLIYFDASGTQTIRVQIREDGLAIDQLVLSPDTYVAASPGATSSDTIILPEQNGTTEASALSGGDIVLYASRARKVGKWQFVSDSTAAADRRIWNPNEGAATVTSPRASPADYFELEFTARADTPYRLWMRAKADSNSGYNDSVWVQFTNTQYEPGTTSATWVNLQDGPGATNKGWGWQDNGYGGFGPLIAFETGGTQTMRVQVREDGISLDQIVLSPDTFLASSPGATKNDAVILPEQNGS